MMRMLASHISSYNTRIARGVSKESDNAAFISDWDFPRLETLIDMDFRSGPASATINLTLMEKVLRTY
jgi:hypothetical protein